MTCSFCADVLMTAHDGFYRTLQQCQAVLAGFEISDTFFHTQIAKRVLARSIQSDDPIRDKSKLVKL